MDDIFVARQPIYDKNNMLLGYELLYRAGDTDVAEFSDGKIASSEVIINSKNDTIITLVAFWTYILAIIKNPAITKITPNRITRNSTNGT